MKVKKILAAWRREPQCGNCQAPHLALFSDLAERDLMGLHLHIEDLEFPAGTIILTVLNTLIDDRSPLKPWPVRQDLGEFHGDLPAQGCDRVRHVSLGSNGHRVGCNFRVGQVFRGSRRFF